MSNREKVAEADCRVLHGVCRRTRLARYYRVTGTAVLVMSFHSLMMMIVTSFHDLITIMIVTSALPSE